MRNYVANYYSINIAGSGNSPILTGGTGVLFATTPTLSINGNVSAFAINSEHMLSNDWAGQNTLMLWNKNASGTSAVRFGYNTDGAEIGAFGGCVNIEPWCNATSSSYWEASNFHDTSQWGVARIIQTKASPFTPTLRFEIKQNGNISFYNQRAMTDPLWAELLTINNSGNIGIGSTTASSLLSIQSTSTNASVNLLTVASSSGLSLFNVRPNGNIGIGTTTPAYTLHVEKVTAGAIAYFKAGANTCTLDPANVGGLSCSSDSRLKTNIQSLDSFGVSSTALDKLVALRPVTYNWISDAEASSTHAGFIAQEVLPLFPDLISTDSGGNYELSYSGFIPYIVSAIQDLNKKIVSSVTNIKSLFVNELQVDTKLQVGGQVCVDSVCITKDQFKQMLLSSGGTVTNNPVISQISTITSSDEISTTTATTSLPEITPIVTPPSTNTTTTNPVTEPQSTNSSPEISPSTNLSSQADETVASSTSL